MSKHRPNSKKLSRRIATWRKQQASKPKAVKQLSPRLKVPRQQIIYPDIRIEKSLANPGFANLVEHLVKDLCFGDATYSPELQEFLQQVARNGAETIISQLRSMSYLLSGQVNLWDTLKFAYEIGNRLVTELTARTGDGLFPFNDIGVEFIGKSVVLGLSSMMVKDEGKKKFYYSRRRFKIDINGNLFILAFNSHAIVRICERFKPDYLTYGGLGDAHGLFSRMNFIEQLTIPNKGNKDGPAVCLFDILCMPGTWEYETYMKLVTPTPKQAIQRSDRSNYAYRVGYCPVYTKGEFAVAYTFLPPGFSKTPEGICLKSDRTLSLAEKDRLRELAQNIDRKSLQFGDAFDAVKWFHEHGYPQVIVPESPVLDHEYIRKMFGRK